MHICFTKFEDFENSQPTLDWQLFEFNLINMDKISNEITKKDFIILEVSKYDLGIIEKESKRKNVIQISFEKLAIMWDLDSNENIFFI